ncbi:hypothetical protein HK104_004480 [Borealophlyctis nickersoniae]|nr:hypothetical protein HK104_004480 [Borealophlyctis nickersoniae]
MDANELYAFLRRTGSTLESFSLSFFYPDGVAVHANPGDRILECLRECAPNLRLLEISSYTKQDVVTEEAVLTFIQASRKLRYMYLPHNLTWSDEMRDAAEERNVVVDHLGYSCFDHPYPYGNSSFPSYVELMKERWIGM